MLQPREWEVGSFSDALVETHGKWSVGESLLLLLSLMLPGATLLGGGKFLMISIAELNNSGALCNFFRDPACLGEMPTLH